MEIAAAVVPSRGAAFEVRPLELDQPRADEVRVRLVASGVCHTDVNIRNQLYPTPLPAVLGHEGAGIVEEIGSAVTAVRVGDHVLLSANSCGACQQCLTGHPAYCEDLFARNFGGRRPDGTTALSSPDGPVSSTFFGQSSFATHANVAQRSVVVVDPDLDLRDLAPLGCGIQTGAGAVLNELRLPLGSTLAVFGAGAVGAGAIMAAVVAGCRTIVAIDVNPSRLELARELGATEVLVSGQDDVGSRIADLTGGRGLDAALDTTGRPDVLRTAADALAIRGQLVLVGAAASGTEVSFEIGDSLNKGWTFRTVVQGGSVAQVFLPALIQLWREGRFPFDRLLRRYRFDEINDAVEDVEHGRTIKPVLVF